MRVLLDACVWGGAVEVIRAAGHDVIWAGSWDEDPGDDEILARAAGERRVLATLDKDFGELAIVHARAHHGIIRFENLGSREQASACIRILGRFGKLLEAGAIVTIAPGRVRIRPPPGEPQ